MIRDLSATQFVDEVSTASCTTASARTQVVPEVQNRTGPRSTFRTVALVVSGLVAVWFVLTTIVVCQSTDGSTWPHP